MSVGALADLIVLDRDLLHEDAEAIAGSQVILTVVDGGVVHAA
jgi:predicted amidohydrolase YtcJ